jgi:tetratricopeptide (TPR) repeat protein
VLDDADLALLRRVHAELAVRAATASDDEDLALLLSLRAVVGRMLMHLDEARADGERALAHAETTGNARLIAGVQARLAHVYQWRREFEPADRLFAAALAAEVPDPLRGHLHQHAGKCLFDQGRYAEARDHFERALDLRRDGDPDLLASTELALAGTLRRLAG